MKPNIPRFCCFSAHLSSPFPRSFVTEQACTRTRVYVQQAYVGMCTIATCKSARRKQRVYRPSSDGSRCLRGRIIDGPTVVEVLRL